MTHYRSLSHTKWTCQYHVVFLPNYRKKVIYGELRRDLGEVLRRLAQQRGGYLQVFWDSLRVEGLAASTRNKYVQILKAMFRWAVRKGYLARNPISEDSALKREKHARRARRLVGDEEQRLIAAAPPRLQRLILGALESGARLGELLSLLWKDVDLARREITIRATNAKNKENRHIPISTRLGAVLEMGRFDPAGVPFGPEDHVFGDEVGRRLRTTQKAWQTAILKANGHTPQWHPRTKRLQPESQAVYQAVDLRFHDLRHEAGSRWLEAGMSIHHVKALLGHASLSTTDIYLNATRVGLHEAMQRVDAKRTTGHPPAYADGRTPRRGGRELGICCKKVARKSVRECQPPCNPGQQWVAQLIAILGVVTTSSGSNSVVECQLPKLKVAGSTPVSRSIRFNRLDVV